MITSLAYLGINSPHKDEWPRMASDFWGAMVTEPGPDGAVRIKFDEALWRIQIHDGEHDETAYLGWGVDREEDLDDIADVLAGLGVVAERGDAELAEARGVNRILVFTDPWGFRHEVTWGQSAVASTFRPGRPISGFVTGQNIESFHFVAAALSPAHIHAQEHLRPVLRLSAAGSGMQGNNRVVCVILA